MTHELSDFAGFDGIQVRVIRGRLPSRVAPGERVTLDFSYRGTPAGYRETAVLVAAERGHPPARVRALLDDWLSGTASSRALAEGQSAEEMAAAYR